MLNRPNWQRYQTFTRGEFDQRRMLVIPRRLLAIATSGLAIVGCWPSCGSHAFLRAQDHTHHESTPSSLVLIPSLELWTAVSRPPLRFLTSIRPEQQPAPGGRGLEDDGWRHSALVRPVASSGKSLSRRGVDLHVGLLRTGRRLLPSPDRRRWSLLSLNDDESTTGVAAPSSAPGECRLQATPPPARCLGPPMAPLVARGPVSRAQALPYPLDAPTSTRSPSEAPPNLLDATGSATASFSPRR